MRFLLLHGIFLLTKCIYHGPKDGWDSMVRP